MQYQKSWFRFDAVAGLNTAAVVIPRCLASAVIAGLPIQAGLYVAIVPAIAYAALGTSRPMSVSTTSTLAILTATELAATVPGADPARLMAAASALALLTGLFLMAAGLLRLGFLANFISDPVLTGFKAGTGLVVVVGQLPHLLGIHIDGGHFFSNIFSTLKHVPETNPTTLILAAATLALLLAMDRFFPHSPAAAVAVAIGIAASGLLALQSAGVAVIGLIPAGVPTPAVPDLSLLGGLWPGALGIALMCFTESIASARASMAHHDPNPEPNRELMALGAANLAGSFFHAFPAGGGASQTALNARAGARSQVSELVTAATAIVTLFFLTPLLGLLPLATLAAIVFVTTLPMLNPADFRAILRVRRMEFWWALAAFAGVILFGTLQGILVAVAISLLTLLYRANHPPVYAVGRDPRTGLFHPLNSESPPDERIPGLLIFKIEGSMTFASAPRAGEGLSALLLQSDAKVAILDCSAIPDVEYTALRALTRSEERLRERGVTLWLAAPNPEVIRMIERSPLGPVLGAGRVFSTLRQAVAAYERKNAAAPPAASSR